MTRSILLICPLANELKFLIKGFKALGHEIKMHSQEKIPIHRFEQLNVFLAVGGHGKTQFAVQTQFLISKFLHLQPMVLCVGAAGALNQDLQVFDLVVGTESIEHDYQEKFTPQSRPPVLSCDPHILKTLKEHYLSLIEAQNFKSGKVHFGSIASGDEDIIHSHRAENLLQQTQALAVAWEGMGGAKACAFNQIPFLELRVITDNAREKVPESFSQNLEHGLGQAALFLQHFLRTAASPQ